MCTHSTTGVYKHSAYLAGTQEHRVVCVLKSDLYGQLRAANNQFGLGMCLLQLQQFLQTGRSVPGDSLASEAEHLLLLLAAQHQLGRKYQVLRGVQRGQGFSLPHASLQLYHHALPLQAAAVLSLRTKRLVCIQDWSVSGATTQVPIECVLHLSLRGAGAVPQQSVHGHYNAGSAEAALGPVEPGDPLLHRMQLCPCTPDTWRENKLYCIKVATE